MTQRKRKSSAIPTGGLAAAPDRIEDDIGDLPLRDQEAARAATERLCDRPARPVAKLEWKDGSLTISAGDEKFALFTALMTDALGSRSGHFANSVMGDLSSILVGSSGKITEGEYNSALAIMSAVAPANELEALLASQMIAANKGAMDSMRMAGKADWLDTRTAGANLANKFMRTFAMQMEALAKLRRGGEQIVKHVHVHEGGQAVVARTINQNGGGVGAKNAGQSDAANEAGRLGGGPALLGQNPPGVTLPISGREGKEAVQDARRHESGRSKGQ